MIKEGDKVKIKNGLFYNKIGIVVMLYKSTSNIDCCLIELDNKAKLGSTILDVEKI